MRFYLLNTQIEGKFLVFPKFLQILINRNLITVIKHPIIIKISTKTVPMILLIQHSISNKIVKFKVISNLTMVNFSLLLILLFQINQMSQIMSFLIALVPLHQQTITPWLQFQTRTSKHNRLIILIPVIRYHREAINITSVEFALGYHGFLFYLTDSSYKRLVESSTCYGLVVTASQESFFFFFVFFLLLELFLLEHFEGLLSFFYVLEDLGVDVEDTVYLVEEELFVVEIQLYSIQFFFGEEPGLVDDVLVVVVEEIEDLFSFHLTLFQGIVLGPVFEKYGTF